MRTIRGALDRLTLQWEAELRRLPCFTQRTAVVLPGVSAMLGGVVALVGWPGADGPARLVPGERAGQAPASRPEPGDRPAPGSSGAGSRSGADAGGATTASGAQGSGGVASGAQGSGGAAGAGAGGPSAAPPTTSPPTTSPQGPLDPVDRLLGPVVSTLLP